MSEIEVLFDLLKEGVSPVQAVASCGKRLKNGGFTELSYEKPWSLAARRQILYQSS